MKKWIVSLLLICTLVSVLSIRVCAMQLFVHIAYDGGKYITLEVEPTDRIEDLKEKIFDQEGISVEDQILMFNDRVLEEGNTLQDYSIQKDSTIRLEVVDQDPPEIPPTGEAYTPEMWAYILMFATVTILLVLRKKRVTQ